MVVESDRRPRLRARPSWRVAVVVAGVAATVASIAADGMVGEWLGEGDEHDAQLTANGVRPTSSKPSLLSP